MNLLTLILLALTLFAACALIVSVRRRALVLAYPLCLLAALVAAGAHLLAMFSVQTFTLQVALGLPTIGLHFRLDPLSALFGVVINIGVFAACVYGLGLAANKQLTRRVEPFFALFALAMNLALLADDAFSFLFAWELMSVTSWALVIADHLHAESRRAAHLYLVMASIGTMALLFTFGALAGPAGGYAFDTIRGANIDPLTSALVLAGVIIGTGSKAGIMPLHAWLPLAHSAAPSHVSALMSGVMTKVAVYALLRIVFDLLGPPAWWWSVPFIALGALSAVGALLYAVVDNDLKRVLAYSTVENIGIIYVGIGLSLAFSASGLHPAAAVAMAAALLHIVNHSWFKSLLFLAAGAVLHATRRRDFDGLGGLIHRMPQTAVFFLVGALAISALPPLNGFVSEWLLFQAVLAGPAFDEPVLRFLAPVVGGLLALAAGLAAACFVRVYGIVFLGRARSDSAANAHEVPRQQLVAMGFLSTLCVAGGLFGAMLVSAIAPVLQHLVGTTLPGAGSGASALSLVAFSAARSTYDAPTIALFVAIAAGLTALLIHRISNRRTRRAPAWDCGFPDPSALTQYSATSFSQPLRRVYGSSLFAVRERIDMPAPGDTRTARLEVTMRDYLWDWLYASPGHWVRLIGLRLNGLQFLSIRRYLVLMFMALISLLLFTAVWA